MPSHSLHPIAIATCLAIVAAPAVADLSNFYGTLYYRFVSADLEDDGGAREDLVYNGYSSASIDRLDNPSGVFGGDLGYKFRPITIFAGIEFSSFDLYYTEHSSWGSTSQSETMGVSNGILGVGYEYRAPQSPIRANFQLECNFPSVGTDFGDYVSEDPGNYVSVSVSVGLSKDTDWGPWGGYGALALGKRMGGAQYPATEGIEVGAEMPGVVVSLVGLIAGAAAAESGAYGSAGCYGDSYVNPAGECVAKPRQCTGTEFGPVCTVGKACGDTCISSSYQCYVGRGLACNSGFRTYP